MSKTITDILYDEIRTTWEWRINIDPEFAASIGCLDQRTMTHAVDPRSIESFIDRFDYIEQAYDRIIQQIPNRNIIPLPNDRVTYDLYIQQLECYIKYQPKYKTYLCCMNRLEGPHTDLPLMASYLSFETTKQRKFYLQFLQEIPQQLDQVMELLTVGLSQQRTPPQISLSNVVEQIRTMVIEEQLNVFCSPLNEKRNLFPDNEQDIYTACIETITGPVTDAFLKLATFLEDTYIPQLRTEISSTIGYPDGVAYYQDCLLFHTTTNMTASDIHQLGLDELCRIRQLMDDIATQEGYAGRLNDYLQYLRTSSDFAPSSAEWLCSYYRDITGRIQPALLKLFHVEILPRMPLSVQEMPPEKAATSPAAYYLSGSLDSTNPRPGIFYVNTPHLGTRRLYECITLALHESIPGHHLQGSIQAENIGLPQFRRNQEDRRYFEVPCRFPFYTAYIEGWGLHSETLGYELDMFTTNAEKMGQLSMEAFRCCRLIVDTGIHTMGWSYDESVNYMINNTAMDKNDIETEVARYITWPGQATAYKVGEYTIRSLRTKAEQELGNAFTVRDFYSVILLCGPVPLQLLTQLVDEYIHTTKTNKKCSSNTDNDVDDNEEYVFVEKEF